MSSTVNNSGSFNPNKYKNNNTGSKPNQRMAGDYMTEFANGAGGDKEKTMSTSGNKDYRTNIEKMLFSNNAGKASSPSNVNAGAAASVNTTSNNGNFTVPGLKQTFNTQAEADAGKAQMDAANSAEAARRANALANQKPFNMQEFMMSQYGKWRQENESSDPNAPKLN